MEDLNLIGTDDEIQSQLKRKIDRLEVKLDSTIKQNQILKSRLENVENILAAICKSLDIDPANFDVNKGNNDKDKEMTWIYSVPSGVGIDAIFKSLFISQDSTFVIELNSLTDLSQNGISLLRLLIEKLNKDAAKQSSNYDALLSTLQNCIHNLKKKNFVVFVKGLPNSEHQKYNLVVEMIACLTDTLGRIWGNEIEEKFSTVALIVQSQSTTRLNNLKLKYKGEDMVIEFEAL